MTAVKDVWKNKALSIFAIASIATSLVFYTPVSAVFLYDRGLTYSQIFSLESILLVSILLIEIPSGILADHIDRRIPIIIGFCLNFVADTLFALSSSFTGFAVSYVFSGLSIALLSGITEAFVYESIGDEADQKATGVFGHFSFLELIAGVLSAVVGSLLAQVDMSYPAYLTALFSLFAVFVTLRLPSHMPHGASSENINLFSDFKKGFKLLFSSPLLMFVCIGASASYVLFNSVYTINQPLYQISNIPMMAWGIINAAALIIAAVYNFFADKIENKLGRKKALFIAMFIGAVGFVFLAIPNPVMSVIGFLMVIVGMNGRGPVTSAVVNKLIPSDLRSTVLNIASSAGSVIGVLINPMIGFLVDCNVIATALVIAGVICVIAFSWLPIADRYLVYEDEPSE